MNKKDLFSVFFILGLVTAGTLSASGSEMSGSGSEAAMARKKAAAQPSAKALGEVVRRFVAVDSKTKGGYFLLWDAPGGEALVLDLEGVHDDKAPRRVDDSTWVMCADFSGIDGKSYEVDFFLKMGKGGRLKIADVVTVHKVDGKARYDWKKKGDRYSRVDP